MIINQYQVDAFADRVFEGNPAAVCPLENWLGDCLLQAIAAENNLSETAFFVPSAKGFSLRWFTPVREIDLCGHATLAAAHVLFGILGYAGESITFETRSGDLVVAQRHGQLAMDFPAMPPKSCAMPEALLQGLGRMPVEVLRADDYLVVFESEAVVRAIAPDFVLLATLDARGISITAPGEAVDFVSRFFAPRYGIPEDPVTGSAHCELAPYWAERLGKSVLRARQVSRRGGSITCEMKGDRVILSGRAVTFMEARIFIEG